jgi:hypothetical protein
MRTVCILALIAVVCMCTDAADLYDSDFTTESGSEGGESEYDRHCLRLYYDIVKDTRGDGDSISDESSGENSEERSADANKGQVVACDSSVDANKRQVVSRNSCSATESEESSEERISDANKGQVVVCDSYSATESGEGQKAVSDRVQENKISDISDESSEESSADASKRQVKRSGGGPGSDLQKRLGDGQKGMDDGCGTSRTRKKGESRKRQGEECRYKQKKRVGNLSAVGGPKDDQSTEKVGHGSSCPGEGAAGVI